MIEEGAYTTERAAALAGVPKSTLARWAQTKLLVPTQSAEPRLWSFNDLMRIRIVEWLRQPKKARDGGEIPPSHMVRIRAALAEIRRLELPLWTEGGVTPLRVARDGRVLIQDGEHLVTATQQLAMGELLDPLAPFETIAGARGPDLLHPRPRLAIRPAKLSGAPHVTGTRLPTLAVAALRRDGLPIEKIAALYPYLGREEIEQALDLEEQLSRNLRVAA